MRFTRASSQLFCCLTGRTWFLEGAYFGLAAWASSKTLGPRPRGRPRKDTGLTPLGYSVVALFHVLLAVSPTCALPVCDMYQARVLRCGGNGGALAWGAGEKGSEDGAVPGTSCLVIKGCIACMPLEALKMRNSVMLYVHRPVHVSHCVPLRVCECVYVWVGASE